MAFYQIGKKSLDLKVVGVGHRGGELFTHGGDSRLANIVSVPNADSESPSQSDLSAFRAAGWRFVPGPDLDWASVRSDSGGGELNPGLLAETPSGRFVILPDKLVVQFDESASAARVKKHLEKFASYRQLSFADNLFEVKLVASDTDLEGSIQNELGRLDALPDVVFAEVSVLYHVGPRPQLAEMDDGFDQWHWNQIQLVEAWNVGNKKHPGKGRGAGSRVAIIDHGFHLSDAELASKVILTATFPTSGSVPVLDSASMPSDAHGTFCAGLVAAQVDGLGINGAAPECSLILIAVPPALSQADLGIALEFCANSGADVISCSLGPSEEDWALSDTLRLAIQFVIGNSRHFNGRVLGAPIIWATFDADENIGSNSVNAFEALLSISQCNVKGARIKSAKGSGLDLLAPGSGVVGIAYSGSTRRIGRESGASYAAPCVAGVAALILALRPELDWKQVHRCIQLGCSPQGTAAAPKTWEHDKGWGVLNALNAVVMALGL